MNKGTTLDIDQVIGTNGVDSPRKPDKNAAEDPFEKGKANRKKIYKWGRVMPVRRPKIEHTVKLYPPKI